MDGTQTLAIALQKTRLTLPPIPLDALPERTKDFILAKANSDNVPPILAITDTLNRAAARAGFPVAKPQPPPAG